MNRTCGIPAIVIMAPDPRDLVSRVNAIMRTAGGILSLLALLGPGGCALSGTGNVSRPVPGAQRRVGPVAPIRPLTVQPGSPAGRTAGTKAGDLDRAASSAYRLRSELQPDVISQADPAEASAHSGGNARPGQEGEPAAARLSFRTILAVQAYLDRQNLSCGCLDGVPGDRTRLAVRTWHISRGLGASPEIDESLLAEMGSPEDYFTTHTVSGEEVDALITVPESWRERSALDHLGYQTVLETVAEEYHAKEATIRRLNPGVEWPNPPEGTALATPNPHPCRKVRAARVTIQLHMKNLLAYDAQNRLIAIFPCSIAAKVEKRPVGQLKVVKAASDPDYLFDPQVFPEEPESKTIHSKLMIAPGPNNPVGVAWLSLDRPGYGIHGTAKPEDIGKTESHGCFRLANWNARKLLSMVSVGTPVTVDP